MAIPQNHDPAPSKSELAGFTREGEALLGMMNEQVTESDDPVVVTQAAALRAWIIAVERVLAGLK